MQPALSIEYFLDDMRQRYFGNRVVLVMFARYGITQINEFLNESLEYLDLNSGDTIDIFLPGYGKYKYHEDVLEDGEEKVKLSCNKLGWSFSLKKFIEFCTVIQKASTWKYRDEFQLVIFNFSNGKIAFDNYISINIEKLIKKGYINSPRELLEIIVQICKSGVTDIIELSDRLGIEYGKEALPSFIVANIPFHLGKSAIKLTPFVTKRR